jgi:transposase
VGAEAMPLALAAFAADERIDAAHRAVLALDGAGWHTAGALVVPDGVDLVFLPPASPEPQPVERIRSLLDEPVANRAFADLAELTDVLVARCSTLRAARRAVKAHTRFHWWPKERRPHRSAQ